MQEIKHNIVGGIIQFGAAEIAHHFANVVVDIALDAETKEDYDDTIAISKELIKAIVFQDIATIRRYACEDGYAATMFPGYTPDDPDFAHVNKILITFENGNRIIIGVDELEY